MNGVSGERVLLLRHQGRLWGVLHDAVRTVTRGHDGFRVWLREGDITADHVLGVIEDLRVWPADGVLARFWGEKVGGLAILGTTPVVVVDPSSPPAIFRSVSGPESSAEPASDSDLGPDMGKTP